MSNAETLAAIAVEAVAGIPDPESDEGSWSIDRQVERLMGPAPVQVSRPFREVLSKIAKAIKHEAKQRPVFVDPFIERADSPVETLFSVFVQLLISCYGDSPLDQQAAQVLGNALYGEPRDLSPRGRWLLTNLTPALAAKPLNALAALATVEVDHLVRGAQFMRSLLQYIPALAVIDADDLDFFAGMCAFVGIVIETIAEPSGNT